MQAFFRIFLLFATGFYSESFIREKECLILDQIDKKIIKLLQENARISITTLSQQLHLSRPSINERINRLVEKGIIQNFTITLAPEKVGQHIFFYIFVSDLKIPFQSFVSKLEDVAAILEAHAVTGKLNYVIKATAPNIDEMTLLLSDLMPYGKMETSIILNSPIPYRLEKFPIT